MKRNTVKELSSEIEANKQSTEGKIQKEEFNNMKGTRKVLRRGELRLIATERIEWISSVERNAVRRIELSGRYEEES